MRMIPRVLILIFLCVFCAGAHAQPVAELVARADRLETQMKETEAFQLFQQVLQQQPHHLHALVRSSELASRIGRHQRTVEERMDFYERALAFARRAVAIKPTDSDANMVMAVAYGRLALMHKAGEKVSNVRDIKTYAEKALLYNPRNFKALHVLGKWHYEVSSLNVFERAGARVFFGGLPRASFDSSIYFYEKAKDLSPGFLLNYLELAKALDKAGKRPRAIQLLRELLRLPDTTSEDRLVKAEANRLLRLWT